MANYNSKRIYNKKLTDGGANYNSGPFAIIILDRGLGIDSIDSIVSNIDISENGIGEENIILIADVKVLDKSIFTDDNVTIVNNVNVADLGIGEEGISVKANVIIGDLGNGVDNVGTVGAFFVIDSNGILEPLGVLVTRDSREELLPSTRDSTEEITGRHGEMDFGTELNARMLELHVATDEGYAPLDKAKLKRLFAMYLDPTKGAKTLIFSDDIEKSYIVKYSGKIDLTNHPSWFEFVLPFKMNDPLIIGSFENMLVGSGKLENKGTFETGLIVEIKGPITNPSLNIGGEVVAYTGTIANGNTLVIDTDLEIAKIGNSNAVDGYNGNFPLLYPGETNVIANSNVTIRWRDKWI